MLVNSAPIRDVLQSRRCHIRGQYIDGRILLDTASFALAGKQVYEHRWIMEQFLGRELTSQEHVHHISGNKADNRLANLTILQRPRITVNIAFLASILPPLRRLRFRRWIPASSPRSLAFRVTPSGGFHAPQLAPSGRKKFGKNRRLPSGQPDRFPTRKPERPRQNADLGRGELVHHMRRAVVGANRERRRPNKSRRRPAFERPSRRRQEWRGWDCGLAGLPACHLRRRRIQRWVDHLVKETFSTSSNVSREHHLFRQIF